MEWLGSLLGLDGWLHRVWRAWRYPVKVKMEVSWTTAPIFVSGVPSTYWRQIEVYVTAGKDEEYIVAGGTLYGRGAQSKPWVELYTLHEHGAIPLPLPVPANRRECFRLSAKRTTSVLREEFGRSLDTAEVKVGLRDLHGSKVLSEILQIDVADLEAEEERF